MGPWSRAWVRARIRHLEALRLYPSVGLRRANRRVAQELLDCAQVRPTLQKVRGERVTQRVGGYSGAPDLERRPPAHVRCGEAPAGLRQEERATPAGVEAGPSALQIAVECPPGVLAHRDDPGPSALALTPDLLGVRVDALELEVHELPGPQAR